MPSLFTETEWNHLSPEIRGLGQVGAMRTLASAGERILEVFEQMSPDEQDAAVKLTANWPHEEEAESSLPADLTYTDYGGQRDLIWRRVRECRHRLDKLYEAQKPSKQLEIDIEALIADGFVADRAVALELLEIFTVEELRNVL